MTRSPTTRNQLTQSNVGGQAHTASFDGTGVRVDSDGHAQIQDRIAGLPMLVSDDNATYTHGPDGPLSSTSSSGSSYGLADALGSTRGVTDAAGSLAGQATYGTYGEPRTGSGTGSAWGQAQVLARGPGPARARVPPAVVAAVVAVVLAVALLSVRTPISMIS